jgi:hypothetical protein
MVCTGWPLVHGPRTCRSRMCWASQTCQSMQPYIFTIKIRKRQSPLKIVNLAWAEEFVFHINDATWLGNLKFAVESWLKCKNKGRHSKMSSRICLCCHTGGEYVMLYGCDYLVSGNMCASAQLRFGVMHESSQKGDCWIPGLAMHPCTASGTLSLWNRTLRTVNAFSWFTASSAILRRCSCRQRQEICAMYRKSSGVFCFTCSAALLQADSPRIMFNPQVLVLAGWARADALGAALQSLVSPQRCTTTCFDVSPIFTRMSRQGTLPINWRARRLLTF